ncbi:MAG: hypothetical protein IM577_14455 [Chitinophagaceae bacterium]|jgi:hypothetical protein|nr:hypothetical protein [Chitinophagaceae bacterium]MCA6516780.1 hypothetical protein [Chitinophagaceae bacterium]
MNKFFLFITFLLVGINSQAQSRWKANFVEIGTWNRYTSNWDFEDRVPVDINISIDNGVVTAGSESFKVTIIKYQGITNTPECRAESWLCRGDNDFDIVTFTVAKYKANDKIIISWMGKKNLLRWHIVD